jgi:dolichyl-phosphate-mannose--protein O-mannosyl transferase
VTATVTDERLTADPEPAPRRWSGAARERITARLDQPMPTDRLAGWISALAVTALAAYLRFADLGRPHAFSFDETYYAKDAYALLKRGYEMDFVPKADKQLLNGRLDVFADAPAYVVHPPLGKWIIALGEQAFGMDPFGWRVAVATLGTLSVLVLARAVRRLTRSTLIGAIAGLLLAIDGLHIVMSRTALLDLPLSFFLLVAFSALLIDRDQARRRAALRLDDFPGTATGPQLGLRPWRIVAGLALGAALACKWNAVWFIAAFGLLTVLWDVGLRRTAGARSPWWGALRRDAVPAFLSMIPVALAAYLTSWWGWLSTSGGYLRGWADQNPATGWVGLVPDPLRSLWHYHQQAFTFHTGLSSSHPYDSHPAGWLILARPVSFFYEESARGQDGCTVDSCVREVIALGNPVVWWGSVAALLVLVWLLVTRRDWRAGALLTAVAAGWLPWFWFAAHDDRTMFSFYAVAFAPFLAAAVAVMLGAAIGPPDASPRRRTAGIVFVGSYLLLAVLAAAALYPLWTAEPFPKDEWFDRLLRLRAWV